MLLATEGLVLDYLPLPGGTARLVRVYGESPCIRLPGCLPGAAGENLPLTELGSYCFAPALREGLPAGAMRCRLEKEGPQPLGPAAETAALHPVCGAFLEELALPDTLRLVGSCAFYNCRGLRRLSVGSEPLALGSDVFLNCFALQDLEVRAAPEAATGLSVLVNNLTGSLRALFCPEGEKEPRAAFWYPEYWEDIEETPAHILLHTFSGQGYHYRQCFLNGRLLADEYDAIFPQGHDADDPVTMALLCLDRLRWPWQLTGQAAGAYREVLSQKALAVTARLLKAQDLAGLRALLALAELDAGTLSAAADLAARADNAEAAALFVEAQRKLRPRRRQYDLDF